ncbi:ensconsin isoform X3 [Culicoides brevitarsis]|uniref:ensconsin isoform X3 n=1 Tax=Culicoides brevitarsis TaxID=469753 RepID=UPI00307C3F91
MGIEEVDHRIPTETLAVLRGILVKSLSRENLSETDLKRELILNNNNQFYHNNYYHAQRKQNRVTRDPSNSNVINNVLQKQNHQRHSTIQKQNIAGNKEPAAPNKQPSRPSSASRGESELNAIHKEREEKIKLMKEKQNEDRQRKLEDLKAQALAAQKFREQKEEERRKRMEELRNRENDRRQQVEERKKAINEAEKERREYILRKDQERQARLETKRRNERSQIAFAFGSSTPRMIETVDCSGMSMSSSFWATRRATSITNMSYGNNTALTRRSSERELGGDSKKRATSAGGLDRQSEDDSGVDSQSYQRANRRKTDLMPTIPSPRDSSRTSFGTHTPRTPARAFSMTRLDQLATPVRRNGEHIRAIVERERKQALEIENLSRLSLSRNSPTDTAADLKRKSRSMSQLAGRRSSNMRRDLSTGSARNSPMTPSATTTTTPSRYKTSTMRKSDTSKSMSQLSDADNETVKRTMRSRRLRQQVKDQLSNSSVTGLRSGEITPTSHHASGSRPGSAMSTSTTASGVVYRRSAPIARKPRPASIAVTGVTPNKDDASDSKRPPLPKPAATRRPTSASNTPSSKTAGSEQPKKIEKPRSARATPAKGTTPLVSPSPDTASKTMEQTIKQASKTVTETLTKETGETVVTKTEQVTQEVTVACNENGAAVISTLDEQKTITETAAAVVDGVIDAAMSGTSTPKVEKTPQPEPRSNSDLDNVDMTASMIAKKITTEEEAKAKLAEKRRLAREEAERQAELERQRQEEEAREILRQEQEIIRLAEEQRRQEQERLQLAIEEAKKREEEEQKKREEEARLKAEKDLEEKRKAEEAEKLRIETAERLKKEEKEREERRKRVEAIMARTRKGGANNTPNKTADDEDKSNNMTQSQILMSQSLTESMIQEIKEVTAENSAESSNNSNSDASSQQQKQPDLTTQTPAANADEPGKNGTGDAHSQYENSVTEKENLLISNFNKNLNLNNGSSNSEQMDANEHHNGKNGSEAHDIGMKTTELIIQDAINQQNGHKNGGFDDMIKPIPVSEAKLNAVNQDLITDQLIDFNNQTAATTTTTDVQMNIDDPLLSFNNNNNLTPLVADSQDNRDLSLL